MAEDIDPNTAKKRRIIHWNPDAGREQISRRWTWKRIVLWTVGGFFGLLFSAGIVIRVVKRLRPELFESGTQVVTPGQTVAAAKTAFISRAKAEQLHEMVSKALNGLRRMPADHPRQREQMILMEKSFDEGHSLLAEHEFAKAGGIFEKLNVEIEAFVTNVKLKGEAKQSYDAILLRIKDLEIARALAPGTLDAAFEAAGAGRQLLTDGNFTGAKKVFDEGFAELKKAEEKLSDFVRENLLVGQRALTKGEKEEAKKAFQIALEKSPGNEVATAGLKRAENIDRVYALLQQGEKFEREAQYAEAAESYKKAFALDAVSAAAQEGQSRASRLEKETKFATAKASADAAVKAKDWVKAISEFQVALKVYPQKTEVQAQLKSAKESAHKEAVAKALARGFDYEKSYQWREARDAYHETLELEPEHADAKEGYTRAGTVIRALLQYERYVEAAEQLSNKADFQGAIRRFNEAMAVKPSYLVNSDRVQQLHTMLMAQNKPVEVTFTSDGNTWVSIQNHRTPSKFESNLIKLLPGNYEVIGRRKGYRDVSMQLQIRNGTPPPTVTVICNMSAARS